MSISIANVGDGEPDQAAQGAIGVGSHVVSQRDRQSGAAGPRYRCVLADAWCARRDPPGEPACEVRVRYREMGLQLRNKMPKRRAKAKLREDRQSVTRPNETWAMDFVHDQLVIGRKLRVLTIIDTFSLLARDRTSVQLPRP